MATGDEPGPATELGIGATKVARLRRSMGVTQADLAEAASISIRTLQRLEAGHYDNPPTAPSCLGRRRSRPHRLDGRLRGRWVRPLPGVVPVDRIRDARRPRRATGRRITAPEQRSHA